MNNIITIASENSKKKKGGGTNAVLTLMKELGDFQDKVASCIEAQDISDRSKKLEIFYEKLDEMAEVLLAMAAEGIKSGRKEVLEDAIDGGVEEVEEDEEVLEEAEETTSSTLADLLSDVPSASTVGKIHMVNAPTIPRLPR